MKKITGFLLILIIFWLVCFSAGSQENNILLQTPEIQNGIVANDSYYYDEITVGSTYFGDKAFQGWEREVYYSLDGGNTWENAQQQELPFRTILDYSVNNFPNSGFTAGNNILYTRAARASGLRARADTMVVVGIYIKSDYNAADIAVLGDGNFVITWRKNNDQGYDSIYCQMFDAQGNKLGARYTVCSQADQSVYFPKARITALNNNSFIITWENHVTPMSPQSFVQARIYLHNNGNIFERNAFELNANAGRYNLAPAIIPTSEGFTALTRQWWWDSNRNFHSGFYGQQYDFNGTPLGSFFNISSTNSSNTEINNSPPAILNLDSGDRVLVWEERPAQLFVQRLDAQYSQTGSRIKVADVEERSWTASENRNNGFFISWQETTGHNISGCFYDNEGNQDGGPFLVTTKPNTEVHRPFANAYIGGGLTLSWLQYNFNAGTYEFVMRKYQPDKNYQEVEYRPQHWAWKYHFANLAATNYYMASYLNYNHNREFCLFAGLKSIHSQSINPECDISIQCKVVDPATGKEWLSPVRSYLYANPQDGQGGQIIYNGGLTNREQVSISIDLPEGRYKSLELYQQTAPLQNNMPGNYSDWEQCDPITTLTREVDFKLTSGYCYRFKYIVTNMADQSYEVIGDNILCCDYTEPQLDILHEQLEQTRLQLSFAYDDTYSGIEQVYYQQNNGPEVEVTVESTEIELVLPQGPSRIKLAAVDKAGNIAAKHIFRVIEMIEPEIHIIGIENQGEYGSELCFRFLSTVPLTDTGVYVDDQVVARVDPGRVNLDLSYYPEGSHRLTIRGTDHQDNIIEKTVNIILKPETFGLAILCPGEKEYGSNKLSVEYWTDVPLTEVWYTLDGGEKQTDMLLTDLPGGTHELTLYAVNSSGTQKSCSVSFSVKEVFPVLEVLSPAAGNIYPDQSIDLIFNTNADVQYTLNEESGSVLSGASLSLPADGEYELTLTATHPVSGNVIRKSISFIIDSVMPEITLHSPVSQLYTYDEINIDYSINKSFCTVEQYLNGDKINVLRDLEPGSHIFRLEVTDRAGHSAVKQVNFEVARLAITSPAEGEKIISETYPCIVPFIYEQEGWFDSVTRILDTGSGQLITEPSGVVIPLETSPGDHELYLRGFRNEFNVSRRTRFQIGRKNITVGKGSIDYTYEKIEMSDEYVADITINVKNSGELDIEKTVAVRLDVINQNGAVTSHWDEIQGLSAKEKAYIEVQDIRVRFGDIFIVQIDPENEIQNEDTSDNNCQISFLTGQITGITGSLADENTFLTAVSVWNEIQVETAGPISYVEIQAGDKVFVDNTPDDGFQTIVDLGLLQPDRNYIQITAFGSNNVILDSCKQYFKIKSLPEQMGSYEFPWSFFSSDEYDDFNHIVTSDIDRKELLSLRNDMLLNTLSAPPCIIPHIEDNKKVTYRILLVAVEQDNPHNQLRNLTYASSQSFQTDIEETFDLGDYADIGSDKKLPNGKGYISEFALDPNARTCAVISITPLFINEAKSSYLNVLQSAWEIVVSDIDHLLFEKLNLEKYFFDRSINNISVNDPNTIKEYRSVENINYLTWEQNFEPGDCFVCGLINDDEYLVEADGQYIATAQGSYNTRVGRSDSDQDSFNLIHPWILSSSYSKNYFTLDIPIIANFKINALIKVLDGRSLLSPVYSKMYQNRTFGPRPLYNKSSSFSFLGGFFGSSTKYNNEFSLTTRVKADVVTATNRELDTVTGIFSNAYGHIRYKVTKEWKRCFFWICWRGKYDVVNYQKSASHGDEYDETDLEEFINNNS